MNLKHQTTRILVINIGTKEDRWLMFCGYDAVKNRLIFFRTLFLSRLPAYHTKESTIITVFRDGKEFESGTPHLTNGHQEKYHLAGLIETQRSNSQSSYFKAFNFLSGDIITIEKFDWKEAEIPLDSIATRRTVGNLSSEVFLNDETLNEQLCDFFPELQLKVATVVFEAYPGSKYANHF